MTAPLITVLMPAYNAERFIGPSIRSVLSQTFSDFELLIIDDGSTDDTKKEVVRFTDRRIRLLSNSQNLGLIETLNRGVREAQGRFIARLDADDLCYPNRFAEQVAVLERRSDVGLVSSWTEVIDENERTKSFGMWRLSPEAIYYVLHFRQCLTHSSVMFRTEVVRGLGGYSKTAIRTEDFDLWYRLSKVSKIVQLPRVLVKWREHSASVTGVGLEEMERNAFRLVQNHIRDVTGEDWPEEIITALVECRSVRHLSNSQRDNFAANLTKVQQGIAQSAPDFYDRDVLRKYMDIEAAKYSHILGHRGKRLASGVPIRARVLGFMYYLTCYHCLPFVGRLVPKSHF